MCSERKGKKRRLEYLMQLLGKMETAASKDGLAEVWGRERVYKRKNQKKGHPTRKQCGKVAKSVVQQRKGLACASTNREDRASEQKLIKKKRGKQRD